MPIYLKVNTTKVETDVILALLFLIYTFKPLCIQFLFMLSFNVAIPIIVV